MTVEELIAAGIPLSGNDDVTALYAEAALDWMQEHTTLQFDKADIATIEALPATAKLFVVKYSETISMRDGVASQSIEGLSMTFNASDKASLLWQLAKTMLGGYLKSRVRVTPAQRRW